MSLVSNLFGTPIVKEVWIFAEYWTESYYPNHPFRITLFTDFNEMKEWSADKSYKARTQGFSGYVSNYWKISWNSLVKGIFSPRF